MRNKQTSIKEKLEREGFLKQATPIVDKKEMLKHPITKVIITGIAIYGFIYVSKHFVNDFVWLVKAVRNAQDNLRR